MKLQAFNNERENGQPLTSTLWQQLTLQVSDARGIDTEMCNIALQHKQLQSTKLYGVITSVCVCVRTQTQSKYNSHW